MRDLLEFILEGIVDKEKFSIEESEEDGKVTLKVIADSDITGLIIGKEGKTVKAIQNLLRVRARLENKSIFLNIESAGESRKLAN